MIKLFKGTQEIKFETTMFPDGTSQVWKIEEGVGFSEANPAKILWVFENEGELMHVCQLSMLLDRLYKVHPVLSVPYLPYGRQDKEVSNTTTFAQFVFFSMLIKAGITITETFDAHSDHPLVRSTPPEAFHKSIIDHDVICFPDKGALNRYYKAFGDFPVIFCEKVRDQQTGEITGLTVHGGEHIKGKRVLMVDDICDGGMTFIKVTEALKQYGPQYVDLAVSHGIFSKGLSPLFQAGIRQVYTTNTRNQEWVDSKRTFKVW